MTVHQIKMVSYVLKCFCVVPIASVISILPLYPISSSKIRNPWPIGVALFSVCLQKHMIQSMRPLWQTTYHTQGKLAQPFVDLCQPGRSTARLKMEINNQHMAKNDTILLREGEAWGKDTKGALRRSWVSMLITDSCRVGQVILVGMFATGFECAF